MADLFPSSLGFDERESAMLQQRCKTFAELHTEERADMVSHKYKIEGFEFSLKVIPVSVFDAEFVTGVESLNASSEDQIYGIRDYKQHPYSMPVFTQYNFLHEPFYYHITEEVLSDGSAITTIPRVIIHNSNLYTGDHQNHFIPDYDIVYDESGEIHANLDRFHKALQRRIQYERQGTRENAISYEVINVQDRKSIFSPLALERAKKKFI